MKTEFDAVKKPAYYNTGTIEVLDFIEDQKLGFHEANIVKYVCRARYKGSELTDLGKAAEYLRRKILILHKQKEEENTKLNEL